MDIDYVRLESRDDSIFVDDQSAHGVVLNQRTFWNVTTALINNNDINLTLLIHEQKNWNSTGNRKEVYQDYQYRKFKQTHNGIFF